MHALSASDIIFCRSAAEYASSPAVKALLMQTARLVKPIAESMSSQQASIEGALRQVQAVCLPSMNRAGSAPTKPACDSNDKRKGLTPSLKEMLAFAGLPVAFSKMDLHHA